MTGSVKKLLVISLALLAASYGCGNPLDSSSTDGEAFVPAPQGMDSCYECHAPDVFEEWLVSRHGNFSVGYFPPVDPFTMKDIFGVPRTYDEITGGPSLPDPLDSTSYLWGCIPCHNGEVIDGNNGGWVLDTQAYGVLFTDPNLGEVARPIIDCEGCHVSGSGHWGAATPPYAAVPAFHECTECHPPADFMLDLAAFADAEHTDHHSLDSTHAWAYGDTAVADLLGWGAPSPIIATTQTLALETFDAYAISATWNSQDYPFRFDPHETINDTHYQGIWIADQDNEVTIYTSPTAMFGYVDLTNTSPNTGMTRADSVDACTASCHGAHEFDLTINEQWFEGAHHPMPAGPVVAVDGTEADPSGPANWGAVEHGFGSSCLRCHNSMGFAEIAPGYGSAVQTPGDSDGFITCNACHDGVNYPSATNKRLRFEGEVALFDYNGDPLRYVDARYGAVCVYCHQGREDGSHVAADIAAGKPRFRNMHYLASAAVMYGEKGCEYAGQNYSGEHLHTQYLDCVGCHMAEEPLADEVGGHTFRMSHGSTEATTFCGPCHGSVTLSSFTAADDVAYMLTVLLHNGIEAYDSPSDADTLANIEYSSTYPYFGTTGPTQQWDAALAKAAFNWQFIKKDPGAYAHNPDYALQLLWDSYEDLYNNDSGISPAPGALTVTRPVP